MVAAFVEHGTENVHSKMLELLLDANGRRSAGAFGFHHEHHTRKGFGEAQTESRVAGTRQIDNDKIELAE